MPQPDSKNNKRFIREQNQALIRYLWLISQLGLVMIASILLFLGLGIGLHYWLQLPSQWLAFFILLGVIAGFWAVYRILKHEFRN